MNSKLIIAVASALFGTVNAVPTTYSNSSITPVDFVSGTYPDATPVDVHPRCPNLNFNWKNQGTVYPPAAGEVTSAESLGNGDYEIVFQFHAADCPPISNLDQLAIIGVDSPEKQTYLLHDSNQKINRIVDSCSWAAKFVVYGEKENNKVCVPGFQIHYSWFSGLASSEYASSFKYNEAYEYSMGCVHDNNNNAQTDFPQYCFDADILPSTPSNSSSIPATSAPASTSSAPQTCLPAWSQCGGQDWLGISECCGDFVCEKSNDYYSQCVPKQTTLSSSAPCTITLTRSSSSSTATASEVTLPASQAELYYQCGGKSWSGPTACVEGATCSSMNPWYYQYVQTAY